MPNEMYRREHPEYFDVAVQETEDMIKLKLAKVAQREEEPSEAPEAYADDE